MADKMTRALLREIAEAQGVDPDRCARWTRMARIILKAESAPQTKMIFDRDMMGMQILRVVPCSTT